MSGRGRGKRKAPEKKPPSPAPEEDDESKEEDDDSEDDGMPTSLLTSTGFGSIAAIPTSFPSLVPSSALMSSAGLQAYLAPGAALDFRDLLRSSDGNAGLRSSDPLGIPLLPTHSIGHNNPSNPLQYSDPAMANIFSYLQNDLPPLPSVDSISGGTLTRGPSDPLNVLTPAPVLSTTPAAHTSTSGPVTSASPAPAASKQSVKAEEGTAQALLSQHSARARAMFEKCEHYKLLVRAIGDQLRALPLPVTAEVYNQLESKHKMLKTAIEEFQAELAQLMSLKEVLDPFEQVKVSYVRQELSVQFKQMELYLSELSFQHEPDGPLPCLAALVISRHPFPKTVFKEKKMPDTVEVRLLSGAKTVTRPLGKVKAFLINEDYQVKNANRKNLITVINDAQDMNDDRVARFVDMQFKMGTGVRKVKLQFELTVEVSVQRPRGKTESEQLSLRSDFSEPLIVMTHRSQWEEAEGILLKYDAFKSTAGPQMLLQIQWNTFANALQRHYLRVTSSPRPLSTRDLNHLQTRFSDPDTITLTDFDHFWKWFGKVSKQIHLQKNLPLWIRGVIYGFTTKKECSELLKGQPEGCAMVRFSEKNAGQLAVAYVKNKSCHHYLMTEEDQKKTLIDFLADRGPIKSLMVVAHDNQGNPGSTVLSKKALLDEFQSSSRKKKKAALTHDGYELDMS